MGVRIAEMGYLIAPFAKKEINVLFRTTAVGRAEALHYKIRHVAQPYKKGAVAQPFRAVSVCRVEALC